MGFIHWRGFVCCLLVLVIMLPGRAFSGEKQLVINLPSRTISYYEDHQLVETYPVAIGSPATPTPVGEYTIILKEVNPTWYPPEQPGVSVISGPLNPLGYRWLGFGGNYGIHGTNAPWSIGSAVSNGCVRMQEADIEALYPKISLGTPLAIIYERLSLLVDHKGWASVLLYPDLYSLQQVSLEDLKQFLANNSLEGWLEDEQLNELLSLGSGRSDIGRLYQIKVNQENLAAQAVERDDVLYIPLLPLARLLPEVLLWNEQEIVWRGHKGKVVMKGPWPYLTLDELSKLFDGKMRVQVSPALLELTIPALVYEHRLLTTALEKRDGEMVWPVLPVAQALGQRVSWDESEGVLKLGCKRLPVAMLHHQPYLTAAKLSEYLNAKIVWNEASLCPELMYPVHPIDYSMYLELWADFRG